MCVCDICPRLNSCPLHSLRIALTHLLSVTYIPSFHIRYCNLELTNWFSVASQRRMENKDISILVLPHTNLPLSKANRNLVIQINNSHWRTCVCAIYTRLSSCLMHIPQNCTMRQYWSYILNSGCGRLIYAADHIAKWLILQFINDERSNLVNGEHNGFNTVS
jgi:hypothetical protein